jgi:hypothetical protein
MYDEARESDPINRPTSSHQYKHVDLASHLSSLDSRESRQALQHHASNLALEGTAFVVEKIIELRHYANEGHWSWKVLGLIASIGTIVTGAFAFLSAFFGFDFLKMIISSFVIMFGVVGAVIEQKPSFVSRYQLALLHREAHFLFRPWGRAMFYFFVGIFLLTQVGFLHTVFGMSNCIIGVIIYYSCRTATDALNSLAAEHFTVERITAKFHEFDSDHDGHLDRNELSLLCESIGTKLTTHELEAVLFILDK